MHGAIPLPMAKEIAHNPDFALLGIAIARGGGLLQHDAKILPGDVRQKVQALMIEHTKQELAKLQDAGQGGASVAGRRDACSTLSSLGAAGSEVFVPRIGGGSTALWCRGRGGRVAPKSLTELQFADHETDLDMAVNDPDERPAAPADGTHRVPAGGLGSMFRFEFPTSEQTEREDVASWVAASAGFVTDLSGRGDKVHSYARSLAGHVLLAEVPDPRGAGLTSDEAWALVRDRVLVLAASSTDSAIAAWARSFSGEYATAEDSAVSGGLGSGPLCKLPDFMRPGDEASCSIFGVQWRVRDHGELLSVGGDVAERAKCLYLSVARSLGMEPEVLLTGLRSQARSFVDTVPAPKRGEMVPEAILYAFELAHDLLERDHPQMRAALLWFGDEILAKHQVNFVCCMPDGDVRVELFKGRQFASSDPSSVLGWCVCASSHARELVAPVSLGSMDAWELTVMERTGVAPGQFHMSGYKHLIRALRSFRGDHRVRDPATLFKCEVCPSACAVPLRVRQRRFIGADDAGSDPLMVMASEAGLASLVSEARTVLSGMSMDREAAEAAAVASVLAGTATVSSAMDRPVGYAGVYDERLGRSTVQELQFRPTGVGLSRRFDLNCGCLRSSGAWGMGEHPSLEAQDSEFLRDERAVRALGAFEAFETALSTSSGEGEERGGTDIPPQSKSRDEWGTRPPAAATSSRQVVATDVSLSKESSDSASSAPSTVNTNDNNTNDNYNDKSGGEFGLRQNVTAP